MVFETRVRILLLTVTTLGLLSLGGAALLADLLDSLTAEAVSVAMSNSPITGLVTTPTAPHPRPDMKPDTPELAAPWMGSVMTLVRPPSTPKPRPLRPATRCCCELSDCFLFSSSRRSSYFWSRLALLRP